MKQMTNDQALMEILRPLTATNKDTRVRLRYIAADNGYAYASDGSVWAKFKIESLSDGLYTEDAGGFFTTSADMAGLKPYNMESVLPEVSALALSASDNLLKAVALIKALPESDRHDKTVLQICGVRAVFDTYNLLRTVKAMTAASGTDFIVEIYPMGVGHLVMFRNADNTAMVAGLRRLPEDELSHVIEYEMLTR